MRAPVNRPDFPTMRQVEKADHEQLARWHRFLPLWRNNRSAENHGADRAIKTERSGDPPLSTQLSGALLQQEREMIEAALAATHGRIAFQRHASPRVVLDKKGLPGVLFDTHRVRTHYFRNVLYQSTCCVVGPSNVAIRFSKNWRSEGLRANVSAVWKCSQALSCLPLLNSNSPRAA
jgi:hypothetical protein